MINFVSERGYCRYIQAEEADVLVWRGPLPKRKYTQLVKSPLTNRVNPQYLNSIVMNALPMACVCILNMFHILSWTRATHTLVFGEGEFAEKGVPCKYLKGAHNQKGNCASKHEEISRALSPQVFHFHYNSWKVQELAECACLKARQMLLLKAMCSLWMALIACKVTLNRGKFSTTLD